MKKSTMKSIFRNKLNHWLNSITDTHVKNLAKRDVMLSGGAIASAFMNEKINDYDLYFKTQETCLAVANYYVERNEIGYSVKLEDRLNCKGEMEKRVIVSKQVVQIDDEEEEHPIPDIETIEKLIEITKKEKYKAVFFSENAISLTGRVQLIMRFYGEPEKIHENYDFSHSMCLYDLSEDKLIIHENAIECMLSKQLIYKGSLYPIASLFRVRKFIKRGWSVSAGQMLKMIFQASKLNLEDRDILREQLLGVDQTYMTQLLNALENRDKNQKIDEVYLGLLIDEVFE